ncbi:MAG: ribosomal protein S18-alanine N-acetyltransferase [Methanocellales archaeon]|nr:ribosomal protein S18-alanine N-acetyltransferase [Methanocellales archaeon]MDD3421462.1 ribosomal protein S18-alanine N-acetyltransferase [Methanocellales archaeon]MDD4898668.1 ribosomal protein S18-alanine N-acetyltransferase [Methanocellales archaeon]MDD5447344.1 ribosomal protein S18-alanine N-acetyltransferase [Methanocellales archaeon]
MFLIRQFIPMDFQQVISIEKDAFREHDPFLYMRLYEMSSEGFLVAEKDGFVAGFVVGILTSNIEGKIFSIAVNKKNRRNGVATLLIKALLDTFRKKGVTNVQLEVRKSNLIAQELYQKLGFDMIGIAPRYYCDGESAIIMRKIINH